VDFGRRRQILRALQAINLRLKSHLLFVIVRADQIGILLARENDQTSGAAYEQHKCQDNAEGPEISGSVTNVGRVHGWISCFAGADGLFPRGPIKTVFNVSTFFPSA
jgi:hypothetical protein